MRGQTAAAPGGGPSGRLLALALALAVTLGLVLWGWANDVPRSAARAAPQAEALIPSKPASVPPDPPPAPPSAPPRTSALAPALAASGVGLPTLAAASDPAASAPGPAAPTQSAAVRAAAPVSPPPVREESAAEREVQRVVMDWLAAEAGSDQDPATLRPFYAETVAYRGQPDAAWSRIAADKAAYMRRWPQRQYQLLSLQALPLGTDGEWRVTLKLRWRLENRGRWRSGDSAVVLTLRRIDGRWRIVAEGGA